MSERKLGISRICVLMLFAVGATCAVGQIEWLRDASNAKIPDGSVTGQIGGRTVAPLKFGHLDTAGGLDFGSPDLSFVHYKIGLQDAEEFYNAKAFAYIMVTVRKGELPDGKAFRSINANWKDQPGIRGEGYWVPEFLSLTFESRKVSMHEQKPGEFGQDTRLSSGVELPFTGRLEFDKRKGNKITARLYVCFDDKAKSCLAGTVEIDIR